MNTLTVKRHLISASEGNMSKPNFTPGPWRVEADFYITSGPKEEFESHAFISDTLTNGQDMPRERVLANAALIAAAPELYEALGCVLQYFADSPDPIYPEQRAQQNAAIRIIKAALAKAGKGQA